ncbi:MAG: clan AA aspartic protease [bacterium]|nr:clan AA aspartic protease [bacterium]
MGETHVDVTIRNPAEQDRCWEGSFLVDTGTTDSQVPRRHLEAIGLRPKDSRDYILADGRALSVEVTTADIEFMGRVVGGTVIFGEDESIPLLGLTALESGGYAVDPVDGRLLHRTLRR